MEIDKSIGTEEWEKLPEPVRDLYTKVGEMYLLNVKGQEPPPASERKAEAEVIRLTAEIEALRAESEERAQKTAEEQTALLKKRNQETVDKLRRELAQRDAFAETHEIQRIAQELAAKISNAPEILLPHLKSRLKAATMNGEVRVQVVDREGRESGISIDELGKEFVNNPTFSSVMKSQNKSVGSQNAENLAGQLLPKATEPSLLADLPIDELTNRIQTHMESRNNGL